MPSERTNVSELLGRLPPELDRPQVVKDPPDHNEANWLYGYDAASSTGYYLYLAAVRDDPTLRRESVFLYLADGSVLAATGEGRGTREGVAAGDRLAFECVEPWRRWVGRYAGPMTRLRGDELVTGPGTDASDVDAAIELETTSVAGPWDTEAGWGEPPPSLRHHQLVTGRGHVDVAGRRVAVGGTGFRSHSRRRRDNLGGYTGHAILNGYFPGTGRGFGLLRYRATADRPERGRGFILLDGTIHDAEVVTWPHLVEARPSGETVVVELLGDGLRATVTGTTVVAPFVTVGTGGRRFGVHPAEDSIYTLSPAICRWEWDGEVTYGPLERSARAEAVRPIATPPDR